MEKSPWESEITSASHEIFHLLWNPNVHYRTHKSTPLVPIMSQTKPAHHNFSEIGSNIYPPIHAWVFQVIFLWKQKESYEHD